MPIYEYQCPKCEKVYEVMQKFSDPPETACPQCAGPVTKIVSRTSFQLKGSGWYVTDYKKPKSENTSEKGSPKKEAKASEAAPAAAKPAATDGGSKPSKE
jgi:putative FmdB family regulatory protein